MSCGRYCHAVLSPALHNVLETSCKEDGEFSLKGLVKGFNAYKEVRSGWLLWGAQCVRACLVVCACCVFTVIVVFPSTLES